MSPNEPFSCELFPSWCYITAPKEIETSKFKVQGQRRSVFPIAPWLSHQQVCLPVIPFLCSWLSLSPGSRIFIGKFCIAWVDWPLHRSHLRTLITVLASTSGATFIKGSCPQPTVCLPSRGRVEWYLRDHYSKQKLLLRGFFLQPPGGATHEPKPWLESLWRRLLNQSSFSSI